VSWDAVKRVLVIGPSSGLTDREFRVLLVLADRLNKRTGQLNPAARRITRDIGLEPTRPAVRSVRRTIADLEAKGWLQRVGSSKGGQEEGRRYPSQSYRLRGDLMSPLRGDTDDRRGDTDDTNRGDLMSPEPKKLEPGKKNLPGASTTRLASPPKGAASAPTPAASGRISDDLLAQVRELDPEAERHTRHDGSEWIELSDGQPLPNAKRAVMWCRYSPEARWGS
jgi:hypothetical protein